MSLQRIDSRFLLPAPVETAVVLGELDGWRSELRAIDVEVAESRTGSPDLLVAPGSHVREAVSSGAEMLLLEGRTSLSRLRSAGYAARRFAALRNLDEPALMLPLDQPAPARYALRSWSGPTRLWQLARNRLAEQMITRGTFVARTLVTVASHSPAPPLIVSAASRLGLPDDLGWFLTLGQGPLARSAFQLFPSSADEPAFVLKFGRVPEARYRFDREAASLERVRKAGGSVAAHAPRLIGRLDVGGLPASLETAAAGERLSSLLTSLGDRGRKLSAIEDVAGWLVETAAETRSPTEPPEEELGYIAERVLPRWRAHGAPADLVERASAVPAVFKHGDPNPENIIVGRHEFTMVDWEDARMRGLPMGEVVGFLTDALALLDGATAPGARDRHFTQLLRGELPSSQVLFRWTRVAAEASGVPAEAVGPLITLLWIDVASASRDYAESGGYSASDSVPAVLPYERLAGLWLSDRALGPGWDRWQS